MNSTTALAIIGAVIVATTAFGLFGVRKIRMSPQQFIVGGRSFGAVFLWLLMAGEVYTSFTFLGAAGWAYGKGAPAFYIICYLTLGCAIGIFVLPFVWRVAQRHNLLTNADYFATCHQSRLLGFLAAAVGVVFLIPYITLQLTGIQILLRIAGYGSIDTTLAAGLAFALIVRAEGFPEINTRRSSSNRLQRNHPAFSGRLIFIDAQKAKRTQRFVWNCSRHRIADRFRGERSDRSRWIECWFCRAACEYSRSSFVLAGWASNRGRLARSHRGRGRNATINLSQG
jgi:hypothetical protein